MSADSSHDRPRRRHWGRWLLAIVVAIPVVGAIAVQALLWSDLPRRWLETQLSESSGLDIRISDLELRWSGRTTARDGTIGRAASGADPFLRAPEVEVQHTPVAALLIGRPLVIRTISGVSPDIVVRQWADETWELEDVIDTLSGDGDGEPGPLPDIRVDGATLRVLRSDHDPILYEQVRATVGDDPIGTVVFSLGWRDSEVEGHVVSDETLEHEVRFDLPEGADALRPFISVREDAKLRGTWSGALDGDRLEGRLQLERESPETGTVSSDVTLAAEGNGMGPVSIDGEIEAHYESGTTTYDARAEVHAEGADWSTISFEASLPWVRWEDDQGPIASGESDLTGTLRGTRLEVSSLTLHRAERSSGSGHVDFATGDWQFRLEADAFDVPRFGEDPITLALESRGHNQAVTIDSLRLRVRGSLFLCNGTYDRSRSPSLEMHQIILAGNFAEDGQEEDASAGPGMRAEVDVVGTLLPLDLSFAGDLVARRLPMVSGAIAEVAAPCRGSVDPRGLSLSAEPFPLLEGTASGQCRVRWQDAMLTFTLNARDVSIEPLFELLDTPFEATGRLSADIDFTMPEGDHEQLELDGTWTMARMTSGPFAAAAASGRARWRNDVLALSECALQKEDGTLQGHMEYDANEDLIQVSMQATRWPMNVPGSNLRFVIDGSGRVDGSHEEQRVDERELDLAAEIIVAGEPAGQVELHAALREWTLELSRLEGTIGGGRISGSGQISLDEWRRTDAVLQWSDVELAVVSAIHDDIPDMDGPCTGRGRVVPSTDPRFRNALQVSARAEMAGGHMLAADLKDASVAGFLSTDRFALRRGVLSVADGNVEVNGWYSTSTSFAQLFFELERLRLDEVSRSLGATTQRPLIGRLSGGGSITIPSSGPVIGTATIDLVDADVTPLPAVSTIYSALRLGVSGTDPRGVGTADLRLEGVQLEVLEGEYFNRGAALAGRIRLGDLTAGKDGSVEGVLVGSVRPFAEINLPVIKQLDLFTQLVQTATSSVRISGTVGDYRVRLVPFAEVANLLSGASRSATGGGRERGDR